ncbi:SH3 domain-containing protein [Luteimonas vadosa]|uniref:SH3 domain-containing protein n=1 Tax=Luteimonas vadosa TaxID=1165507 RepID=A0ABP9E347_9GAMM
MQAARLDPDYWIRRLDQPDRIVLDAAAIRRLNASLVAEEPSLHDLESLPALLPAGQVRSWIEALSVEPTRQLHGVDGHALPRQAFERLRENLALDAIPERQPVRYGLVVRRADLRTFPTRLRVFREPGDTDIDRFQESALFPGTPVAITHESRDGDWFFVVAPNYAAWIEQRHVALGSKRDVFDYTRRKPFRVVTDPTVRTVHAPEAPRVSGLQLDMGVRVPALDRWPADQPVNGQHPGFGHAVQLPVRSESGLLEFSPALLPRRAGLADDYLSLTRANLLRQAFNFLGERYGWGHAYDARDCSGFVAEVYRSFGLQLPRNTGDQSRSKALDRIDVSALDSRGERRAVVDGTAAGDLVYIPGHVMMVVGHVGGEPWVIHDIHGMNLRAADGGTRRVVLNAVVVTPLLPMLADDGTPILDHVTTIVRIGR